MRCSIPIVSLCNCCLDHKIETEEHLFNDSNVASKASSYFADVFGSSNLNNLSWRDKCIGCWNLSF